MELLKVMFPIKKNNPNSDFQIGVIQKKTKL